MAWTIHGAGATNNSITKRKIIGQHIQYNDDRNSGKGLTHTQSLPLIDPCLLKALGVTMSYVVTG